VCADGVVIDKIERKRGREQCMAGRHYPVVPCIDGSHIAQLDTVGWIVAGDG
jgi:hypothetical protein